MLTFNREQIYFDLNKFFLMLWTKSSSIFFIFILMAASKFRYIWKVNLRFYYCVVGILSKSFPKWIFHLSLYYSDIDEYGFKRDEDFDYKGYETVMKSYLTVLTNRRIKWDKYMKKKPNLFRNNTNQLKRYVRKGIPGKRKMNIFVHFFFIYWRNSFLFPLTFN